MVKKEFLFETDYKNRNELFKKTTEYLLTKGYVTSEFEEALIQRESEFPTGLPTIPAVAIPHTDGTYVKKDTILCILNKNEIEFNEMGGDEKDIVNPRVFFMLVMSEGGAHLEELQNLIVKIQDGNLVAAALNSNTETEFQEAVNQYL